MAKMRIGSYNVENLFRRAKLLNYVDNDDAAPNLQKLQESQGLLAKQTYSAADKTKIAKLIKDLKGFITINEYAGRLLNNSGSVTARGRDDWYGAVDLVFAKFDETTRKNTAKVIKQLNADVLCVVEAEDRLAIDGFAKQTLKGTSAFEPYEFNMLIDGNDQRGIDVGVYSRFPIVDVRTNIFLKDADGRVFSRDCLEVEVKLPGSAGSLHVLVNHLKSKGYGDQAENDRKRKRQADAVRKILGERYDLSKDRVVVAGDLNDTPDSGPLKALYGNSGLKDALLGLDEKDRWTYEYRGELNQIDYLLASKPLSDKFAGAGVERRGMFKIDKITGGAMKPFPSVTRPTESASDHAGIFADYDI